MSRPSRFDLGIDNSGQVPPTSWWRRQVSAAILFAVIAVAAVVAGLYVFPM